MPDYDLDRLGPIEFEKLIQSLVMAAMKAPGTVIFGSGRDGAREATFTGTLEYPSSIEQWNGHWIFQAKFHDINLIKPIKARAAVLTDLQSELQKITEKYKYNCDNFILITNVRLSSTHKTGTTDQINEISRRFPQIKNIHVWGGDTICRLLDGHPGLRQTYADFLTPGDLIQSLLNLKPHEGLTETTRLYLKYWHDRDQFAQLTQAGEPDTGPRMHLRNVFVDLELKPKGRLFWSTSRHFFCRPDDSDGNSPHHPRREAPLDDGTVECDPVEIGISSHDTENALSATRTLLSGKFPRIVLIAGPGYGKSTLTQYVAQWHRARLLGYETDRQATPTPPRIPLRIELKHFAQWLSKNLESTTESYLALKFKEATARDTTAEQIQKIVTTNPTLLLLDGLDEVMNPDLRTQMLARIRDFIFRAEALDANIHTIATSRPTGYGDEFDPNNHSHFQVLALSETRSQEYAKRWVEARQLSAEEHHRILDTLAHAQASEHTRSILTTPLQVTIVLVIIKDRGRPPAQREALFQRYWDTILSREKSKSNEVIKSEEGLLLDLHAHLGYILHRRAEGSATDSLLSSDQFESVVLDFLKSRDHRADEATLAHRARSLLVEARNRLVLIVEPKPGFIGFELRSLQEFFAAVHLVQTATTTKVRLDRLKGISLSFHWRNVALFSVGRVARNNIGEAGAILQSVCRPLDRSSLGKALRRGATFALEITADGAFSVNRDLQYGALEYGLEYLNTPQAFAQREWTLGFFSSLPLEDKNELLKPLLEEALSERSISIPHTWTYLRILGFNETIGRVVINALSSDEPDNVAAILACCLTTVPEEWLAKQIKTTSTSHILWSETFWEIIDNDNDNEDRNSHLSKYAYLGRLADLLALEESDADRIFGKLTTLCLTQRFELVEPANSSHERGKFETLFIAAATLAQSIPDISTPAVQLDLVSGRIFTKNISIGSDLPIEQAAKFDASLATNSLQPNLRRFIWWALLTRSEATEPRLLAFLQDKQRLSTDAYDPLTYEIEERWPILKELFVLEQGILLPDTLRPAIAPEKQTNYAIQIRDALIDAGKTIPPHERQLLWHAIHIKDESKISKLIPKIEKIATELSAPPSQVLAIFTHTISAQRLHDASQTLSTEELQYTLNQLENTEDAVLKLPSVFASILEAVWPNNCDFAEQAARILTRLTTIHAHEPAWTRNLDVYIALLTKHILHRSPRSTTSIEPFLIHIRELAPPSPSTKFTTQYAVSGESMRGLRLLKQFIHTSDVTLAHGAALVCYHVIPESWRRRSRRFSGLKPGPMSHVGLDETALKRFIRSSNPSEFWVGAYLMGQLPIDISTPSKRRALLSILERLSDANEARARDVLEGILANSANDDDLVAFILALLSSGSNAEKLLWESALNGLERISSNKGVTKRWEREVGLRSK